jgi:hypothetical protein
MAEFLSAAWIDELDVAARTATELVADPPFVVEQVVRDTGADDVRYRVRIGPDGASVRTDATADAADAADAPDLVLVTDRATARELHEGSLRAQDALAQGALKVRGRPEVLGRRAEILARLDAAFATVRAGTTFAGDR